jgi:hypothetical protein
LKYREEFLGRFGALMQPDTYAARCTVSCCWQKTTHLIPVQKFPIHIILDF